MTKDNRQITCKYCGKLFTPTKSNKVYCSEECRALGKEQTRKAWEIRTNYREKDRERKRVKTAATRTAAERSRVVLDRIKKEEREKKAAENLARCRAAYQEKLEAGDPFTLMMDALYRGGNASPEYLERFAAYVIHEAEAAGHISTTTINDVSVYDPMFAEKVLNSLSDEGLMVIRHNYIST